MHHCLQIWVEFSNLEFSKGILSKSDLSWGDPKFFLGNIFFSTEKIEPLAAIFGTIAQGTKIVYVIE